MNAPAPLTDFQLKQLAALNLSEEKAAMYANSLDRKDWEANDGSVGIEVPPWTAKTIIFLMSWAPSGEAS